MMQQKGKFSQKTQSGLLHLPSALFLLGFVLIPIVLPMNANADFPGEKPLIMAHRGSSGEAPENTKVAIAKAIEQGAKVIEFDVRQTQDGVLVLFHDKTFERFTGSKGSVEDQTWEQIKDSDVGSWFTKGDFNGEKIPLFRDAMQQCVEAGVVPLIERKTGDPDKYAEVIKDLDCAGGVIVQSFDWEFLRSFQKLMPVVVVGALGSKKLSSEKFAELKSFSPDWVGWNYKDLSVSEMEKLQGEGFKVTLWTVNGASDVQRWVDAGIDGIITDYPETMLRLVDSAD